MKFGLQDRLLKTLTSVLSNANTIIHPAGFSVIVQMYSTNNYYSRNYAYDHSKQYRHPEDTKSNSFKRTKTNFQ